MKISEKKIHLITLLIGFSQIYAWATAYYLPATLITIVPAELQQNPLVIIGGFSWALLLGGMSAPAIGRWIEREGGRKPLTAGSLCMGTGLFILSAAHGIFIWYLAWTFIGLGMALGLFNAAFATIGRLLGESSRKIIIRVTLISGFATLFWPITTFLIQSYGWRLMAMVYGVFHILLWAPLFYRIIPAFVPEHPVSGSEANPAVSKKTKYLFYLLAIYAVLRGVVGTTISVDILALFEGLGMTIKEAAIAASLIGPAQIAGRLIELFFGQRLNLLKSSTFWTAVLPLSIVILLILRQSGAAVFALLYGMSNGVLAITMGILPMMLFGSKGYASLLGKLALPMLIAQALTPLLISPTQASALSIFRLSGILGLGAVICMVMLLILNARWRKRQDSNLRYG